MSYYCYCYYPVTITITKRRLDSKHFWELLTEILLPRIARRGTLRLVSIRGSARKARAALRWRPDSQFFPRVHTIIYKGISATDSPTIISNSIGFQTTLEFQPSGNICMYPFYKSQGFYESIVGEMVVKSQN